MVEHMNSYLSQRNQYKVKRSLVQDWNLDRWFHFQRYRFNIILKLLLLQLLLLLLFSLFFYHYYCIVNLILTRSNSLVGLFQAKIKLILPRREIILTLKYHWILSIKTSQVLQGHCLMCPLQIKEVTEKKKEGKDINLNSTWINNVFYLEHGKKKQDFICYIYPIYQPLRSGRIWHKVNF